MKGIFSCFLCVFFIIALMASVAYSESWWEGKILLSGEVREWKDPVTRPVSLFIMDADGSNFTRICDLNALFVKGYALSPDCQKVLFCDKPGKGEGPGDIYIMDINGRNKMNLTNTEFIHEYCPCWSPDGRQIVYVEDRLVEKWICVSDLLNRNVKKLHEGTLPDWSSKGKILFYFNGNIWKMNADGSEPVKLTRAGLPDHPWYIRWSPDGSSIVFECNDDIYIIDENGGNLRNLTNSNFVEGTPCWSPNGEKIAFISLRQDGKSHLYIMNPDGSNIERLIKDDMEERETKCLEDWRSAVNSSIRVMDTSKTSTWGRIKVK